VVPTWFEEKPKKNGSALKESGAEAGSNQNRTVWRPKIMPDGSGHSAPTCMVCFLPNKFMAPANQVVQEEASPDIDEAEQIGLMAQLVLSKQATFDKPAKIGT
jgi:hypothetical protein